ncbi:hypothetical protein GCM10023093_30180 [Nemorincola caseinilytica]|uniref:Uncharacterized protein n=1 Tax=Nemorincola caseinilytica TaxID=2054315 RepID=A0ABP8NRN8_9BACT
MTFAKRPHAKKARKRALSSEITYPRKFVRAVKWKDNSGDNVVVFTRTKRSKSASRPEEGYYEQQLEVRYFLNDGKHWRQKWNVHDQVMECDHEMVANYVKKTFAVTDLDEDGTAEVWLVYRTGCGVDEHPANMKVVMYEGQTRYSMRGRVRMKINENKYDGGEYDLDPGFAKVPAFKQYAVDLWESNSEN